jgi:hypothetical protein
MVESIRSSTMNLNFIIDQLFNRDRSMYHHRSNNTVVCRYGFTVRSSVRLDAVLGVTLRENEPNWKLDRRSRGAAEVVAYARRSIRSIDASTT